jgi:LysR family glycine cleavage system transcriptional activator
MPVLKQPSLLSLRAFEAAARRLSFTEAARELNVSQAAVSRHVRRLEQDLERPLFRRLHRRVELTQPGGQLARELGIHFKQIGRAVEAIRGVRARSLRVTVERAFGARWLVQRLGDFSLSHPDVELDLETSDELRTLGRDADVAIRFRSVGSRRQWRGADRLVVMDGVPVIAGTRAAPRKKPNDARVAEYRLLHDDDGTAWRSWFAAAGLSDYDRARHLRFNDYTLALAAAKRGQGVVLGADFFIRSELRSGRLMAIGETRVPLGDYWLLEASDRATAAPRRAFVQWLEKQIRRLG